MQSSYNVIKNNDIIPRGNKEIVTNVDNIRKYNNSDDSNENEDLKAQRAEVELLANNIIEDANRLSEEIIAKGAETAKKIEKEAHESGYEAGSKEGYGVGYEKALATARLEADLIIANANKLLLNAKLEYENYLEEKKDEIIHLAINMAETVLKRELSTKDGLNEILLEVIQNSKNAKSFIIKANDIHTAEIKSNIENWKLSLGLKGEVFIVEDNSLGEYDAVVEKNNGRVEIGLIAGIEGIRQALL
jgi:flagellar assembly protein FliH